MRWQKRKECRKFYESLCFMIPVLRKKGEPHSTRCISFLKTRRTQIITTILRISQIKLSSYITIVAFSIRSSFYLVNFLNAIRSSLFLQKNIHFFTNMYKIFKTNPIYSNITFSLSIDSFKKNIPSLNQNYIHARTHTPRDEQACRDIHPNTFQYS